MRTAIRTLFLLMLVFVANVNAGEKTVKIQFNYHGKTVIGSLEDNPASREFLAMLPLTVKMEDYGAVEKVAWLPDKLNKANTLPAITPATGDIAYYIPWGNLAIFRQDFRHSPGLIKLGRIDEELAALQQSGSAEVRITRVENQ
ncbi:cyclophilin [Serratia rubidaea]|nr:cyclophilin [Serratia rubidaea]